MNLNLLFVLLFINIIHNAITDTTKDEEEEAENARKKILNQLVRARTVILDGYHLVTRQLVTDVFRYRNYRSVSVLFYPVVRDVYEAQFTFQSEEIQLNNIGSCRPKTVVINLKHGSYPAVNPDGYSWPKGFVNPESRESTYTIELQSNGSNVTYSVYNPNPGNWYGLAYIKWEDPQTQPVEQQGLVPVCQTILYTDLQTKSQDNIHLIDCYEAVTWDYSRIPSILKCISLDNSDPITLNFTITNIPTDHFNISIKVRASAVPIEENNILSCVIDLTSTTTQSIRFFPNPNSWHYMQLNLTSESEGIADCESYDLKTYVEIENHTIADLMREDKGRFFTFDYGLPTTDLQDSTSMLNLTAGEIQTVRFKVNQFLDIGGVLTIEASLLMSMKYYMGYRREMTKGMLMAFSDEDQFFKVVICLDIGHPSIPLQSGLCKFNDIDKPALFVLNSTDSESIYEKVVIPFPDEGMWYLAARLFCDDSVCPCKMSLNGSNYYVGTNEIEVDAKDFSNVTRAGVSSCSGTTILSISSTQCAGSSCGNHGVCVTQNLGGMVVSFCICDEGYGGWDCQDDSRLPQKWSQLIAVLLLTLSNLPFMVSGYVAIIRLYYTEGMIYLLTMVFSTFYHACDADSGVAYCIIRRNVLQFGDFYCGIMSFWVTLIAMAVLSAKLRSFLRLIGAIVIALITTWNMHSIFAFLLPVSVGVCFVFGSWYLHYKRFGKMSYPRSYYTKYLTTGLVLVSTGLLCFAFFQTEKNYSIVHSVWHMSIAVSVIFLLPDAKRDGQHPFLPSPNFCSISRPSICRLLRPPSPVAED